MNYSYNIIDDVYHWMVSRKKDVEVRVLKEKSEAIQIGDYITFKNLDKQGKYVKVKVINKVIVNSMEELLDTFDVNRMMPGHTKEELKELMNKIYKEELNEKQIVGIEFEYLYSDNDITLSDTITCNEFLEVIESVGFKTYPIHQVEKALKNTMYMVKAEVNGK